MAESIEVVLRSALKDAMRERRRDDVGAIRLCLSALDNAGAVDATTVDAGVSEVARRPVGDDEARAIVAGEAADLRAAAAERRSLGLPDEADVADAQAALLERLLAST